MQMINIGSSQLYETKQFLLILRLAELQAAVIAHFVHNGQAGQFVTLAAQLVAARLEAFFDGNSDTFHRCTCIIADGDESLKRTAVCKEIINNENVVIRT